ncbi:cyclodeaminase/cyclohydrolase family protein [Clostridium sp. SM-530-WT-3G]|uniref:cyclodeaminase/cyclohydrolase family protein n=1 Tax=Clostridium sp. SM-530-WT-3G TaxID=2725303 RepID=UPI00145E3CA4|nr:cyclodeaminase/cyclohydrolase family protein [Clostridium sp. SM-530-WT-3G]NME82403.1 cyclodeaminase/cyclohydrolase family protein [Clostridium sp. SM-530-WT-3G]
MNFKEQSIKEFLRDLESDLPAPGGGSVAGLISALAGALNSMVYSLTVGKKAYMNLEESEKELINNFQEESRRFTIRSLELMDLDKENFLELMESYKLPKNTEDEIQLRKKAIRDNTIKSMEAPLALARESLRFYDSLKVMNKYGNKMLLSDLSISAILLNSAIESSIINVKVNLNSLRNEEFFESIDKELINIQEESERNKKEICESIEKIIY